jgi:alkylation response protein AidB-like acyl-CoA dehydrogenase
MSAPKASSSTSGFFQALPVVPAQYTSSETNQVNHGVSDDPIFSRILSIYLPEPLPAHVSTQLHNFSRLVLAPSTLQHTVDCDTDLPTLHPLTTFGEENRVSALRTSEGWRVLKRIETEAGVVGYGYPQSGVQQNFNRRIHQFATLNLWHGSAAVTTCPMAMTDGAAVLLRRHLDDPDGDQPGRGKVFSEAYRRLVSLDPSYAWTSGQWMTERSGGSDVRGTETVARRLTEAELQDDVKLGRDQDTVGLPLGPWLIDGFKWFSSATDADMAVLLAQTGKGLSAFCAPLRRRTGTSTTTPPETLTTETGKVGASSQPTEMNGVRIQRLKNKLGTKGVPTAELELKSMRAYLIGSEGQGVKEISSILNITRLHTAAGANGTLARGLAVSRAYTKVRKVREQILSDNPQHLAWMAGETVKYRANAHLVSLNVALLGASEQGHEAVASTRAESVLIPKQKAQIDMLLRLLTPVMKAQVSLNSVSGLRACMESLGGVGYCENNEDGGVLNIARLFRDSVVNTIWEGTTSVMAEDVLRVLLPKTKNSTNNAASNEKSRGSSAAKKETTILDTILGTWTRNVLSHVAKQAPARTFKSEIEVVETRYRALNELIRDTGDAEELHWRGREVLDGVEAVTSACLLLFDASVDHDEAAVAVARRWVKSFVALPRDRLYKERDFDWKTEVRLDRLIFLGGQPNGLGVNASASSNGSVIQSKL